MVADEPLIRDDSRFNTISTAKLLGIDRTTLYRAMKHGYINYCLTVTGKHCYKGKDIKKFWRQHI